MDGGGGGTPSQLWMVGGTPSQVWMLGGYLGYPPRPGLDGAGYPILGLDGGGYLGSSPGPGLDGGGKGGYPILGLDLGHLGYPPDQVWMVGGYPGVPPHETE